MGLGFRECVQFGMPCEIGFIKDNYNGIIKCKCKRYNPVHPIASTYTNIQSTRRTPEPLLPVLHSVH